MPRYKKDLKDADIIDMYLHGMSSTQIAQKLKASHRTILLRLKKHTIERRSLIEAQWNFKKRELPKDFDNKELLETLYLKEGMSKKELGLKYNCDPCVIDRVLKFHGIPVRNNSESKKGLKVGKDHPNWKGGVSSLSERIREYCRVNICKEVLERDKNRCIICGSTDNLHVHHLIPFKTILHRILLQNLSLSPVIDNDALYQIAIKDSELNNKNNLITVCSMCHRKIHGQI